MQVRQKLKMLKTDNERLTAEKERTEEHSKQVSCYLHTVTMHGQTIVSHQDIATYVLITYC